VKKRTLLSGDSASLPGGKEQHDGSSFSGYSRYWTSCLDVEYLE